MIHHTVRVLCAFMLLTISISAQKQPNFAPDAYKKLASLAGVIGWVDELGKRANSTSKTAASLAFVIDGGTCELIYRRRSP